MECFWNFGFGIDKKKKKMEESRSLGRANCRAKGASPGFKVAILGAAGGIGQPLALLMKMNPLVSLLHLYDVVNTPGVTSDISHMDTGAVVIKFPLFLISKNVWSNYNCAKSFQFGASGMRVLRDWCVLECHLVRCVDSWGRLGWRMPWRAWTL